VQRVFGERTPRAVLDLACGAGRHTQVLRRRGVRALGTDLSLTLLVRARRLPRVAADMRRLPFADGTFDWVLNFFTSFGYFESERENFEVLEEVERLLAPAGRFLIDLFNRERVVAGLVASDTQCIGDRRVVVERRFDAGRQRVEKRIRIVEGPGAGREFLESVRAYGREEVEIGLEWAGLRVDGVFGNFAGQPYSSEGERLIVVGHKRSTAR
jgi:SAM-dependent methyltransferase